MRVIAGEYRSRLLAAPAGAATRPTSDKLRGTLFNVLAHWPGVELRGGVFADLFAGSGAVGIEALSRGAAHCFFVEQAGPAIAAIKKNLAALAIASDRATIVRGDALDFVRAMSRPCDVVFLDPPYEDADCYAGILSFLGSGPGQTKLQPGALIIAEHAARHAAAQVAEEYGRLRRARLLPQGDAALSFYSRKTD